MRPMIFCLLFASSVTYAQAFHKCVAPDGTVTFTDVTCPKHKEQKYHKSDLGDEDAVSNASTIPEGDKKASPEKQRLNPAKSSSSNPVTQR